MCQVRVDDVRPVTQTRRFENEFVVHNLSHSLSSRSSTVTYDFPEVPRTSSDTEILQLEDGGLLFTWQSDFPATMRSGSVRLHTNLGAPQHTRCSGAVCNK